MTRVMSRADHWKTIEWINSLRPSNEPYPLVALGQGLVVNEPGCVMAQIFTNRFPTRDTIGSLLELMRTHFGEPHDFDIRSSRVRYEWTLETTRWVQIIHVPGRGTFVQLLDKGVPV